MKLLNLMSLWTAWTEETQPLMWGTGCGQFCSPSLTGNQPALGTTEGGQPGSITLAGCNLSRKIERIYSPPYGVGACSSIFPGCALRRAGACTNFSISSTPFGRLKCTILPSVLADEPILSNKGVVLWDQTWQTNTHNQLHLIFCLPERIVLQYASHDSLLKLWQKVISSLVCLNKFISPCLGRLPGRLFTWKSFKVLVGMLCYTLTLKLVKPGLKNLEMYLPL